MGVTRNPKMNLQLLPGAQVDAFADRRVLIVGQTEGSGTAVSGGLNLDVHSMTDAQRSGLFGTGELYWSIQHYMAGNGGFSALDVISVDENGSAADATAVVTFTGTATGAGTINVSIVDQRSFTMAIQVAVGDTAAAVATKLVTAVNNLTNPVFTAAATTGTVTFTAKDGGTYGNLYGARVSGAAAGITYALTGWTGGATNPTLTSIFDPIAGRRYTGIVWPEAWASDISIPIDLLAARFNPSNDILDGVCIHGNDDTLANRKTFVSTLNSQSLVVLGNNRVNETFDKGPAILQPATWRASYFAGVRARRLSPSAPIADFITASNSPLDNIGGPGLASLPYFNTPFNRTAVELPANLFSPQEQVELEDDGTSTLGVNPAGNTMIAGAIVTTWTTDASGNANDSFHYLNYVDTGSVCREIIFNTLSSLYSQSRLTTGDLIPQRSIVNATKIKADLLSIYRTLSGVALVQAGTDAEAYFSDNTTVEVDLAQRSVTIAGPLPIVTQVGQIDYPIQISFSITSTGTTVSF